MKRTITPQEVKDLLVSQELLLIDVRRRTDREADPVIISGAVWRDPQQIEIWSHELPADKEVIIYCVRGGSVSNAVLDELIGKGIRARYMEGGIEAWKASGGQVTP